jgi:hypothetical protein
MSLTMHEFKRGVAYWETTRWPKDFHNGFYGDLAQQDPRGNFTEAWWQGFLPHLRTWKATRPARTAVLTREATDSLPTLRETWARCCSPVAGRDVAEVDWTDVADFPAVVAGIKPDRSLLQPVRSPVFTAKFCHFLLPAVFPVVDRAAMGLPFGATYQAHFEGVRREWAATPDSTCQELHTALRSRIDAPLVPGYPLTNKVIELCLIGRRN